MSNAPTPAEVERAKKWAAMNRVVVEKSRHDDGVWFVKNLPELFRFPGVFIHHTEDAAWHALAIALRPVFASVAPIVREECAVVVESSLIDRGNFIGGYSTYDIKKPAIEHAAGAIRAMS